ncbi:MAG: type II secretion system protein, partial [Phycisphaerales bacterium]
MRIPARRTAGFSVVEILVVLGIVIGVISTVIVGLNVAAGRARTANTEFLLNSMTSAITRFRSETGYLPLSLGDPGLLGGSGTPRGRDAPAAERHRPRGRGRTPRSSGIRRARCAHEFRISLR